MRQRIESDLKKQQKERARVLEMQQQMKAKKDKVRQDD